MRIYIVERIASLGGETSQYPVASFLTRPEADEYVKGCPSYAPYGDEMMILHHRVLFTDLCYMANRDVYPLDARRLAERTGR